jgi:prevent-host-death family protein
MRETNAPYLVGADDQALGTETIVIQRNGRPIAVVVPYEEYAALIAQQTHQPSPPESAPDELARERAAFERKLPGLLAAHHGEWVAFVDEQPVEFGSDFSSVIRRVRARFGQRPVYVQEIREQPRVYKMSAPRLSRT